MTNFDPFEAEFPKHSDVLAAPDPVRPAPPDRGVGVMLRRAIGVKEDILDWSPEERPRYTKLGIIVIATSTLAAVSMLSALTRVTDMPLYARIPLCLLWGALIFAFDSWLIASTHGIQHLFSFAVFLPRLLISLLIGAVIAEPLILTIFGPSISTQVQRAQQQAALDYGSKLTQCNSTALGAPSTDPTCTDYLLNIQSDAKAISDQLDDTNQQRSTLQTQYDALNTQYNALNTHAQEECAGTTGPGLTGVSGEGGQCRRDREDADNFKNINQLDEKVATLAALTDKQTTLTASLSASKAKLAKDVDDAISKKTQDFVKAQQTAGLLDEDKALGVLTSQSTFVLVASWLLRLLLIAIDTLPVLVKMIGGKTTYDKNARQRLEKSYALHSRALSLEDEEDETKGQIRRHAMKTRRKQAIEEINEAARTHRSDKRAQIDLEVAQLAAQLRGQAPTSP